MFGIITIDYIQNIYFENNEDRQRYQDVIPSDISAKVCTEVFRPRKDWEAW